MQSTQYEYDASDWLDSDETSSCENSKQSRKQSKKDWKENRREQRDRKRGDWNE